VRSRGEADGISAAKYFLANFSLIMTVVGTQFHFFGAVFDDVLSFHGEVASGDDGTPRVAK